ncbi:hypothetical protein [Pseudomonas oryzihabitans]|nr:hypothetical protein [Pseudomonas oryzihabitans]MDT3723267.1 hypothetical protein [Pseudomonas oryzihabitans]
MAADGTRGLMRFFDHAAKAIARKIQACRLSVRGFEKRVQNTVGFLQGI